VRPPAWMFTHRVAVVAPRSPGRAPAEAGHDVGEALTQPQLLVGLVFAAGECPGPRKPDKVEQQSTRTEHPQQGGLNSATKALQHIGSEGRQGELGQDRWGSHRSGAVSTPGRHQGDGRAKKHANSGPGSAGRLIRLRRPHRERPKGDQGQQLIPALENALQQLGQALQGADHTPPWAGPCRAGAPILQHDQNRRRCRHEARDHRVRHLGDVADPGGRRRRGSGTPRRAINHGEGDRQGLGRAVGPCGDGWRHRR